MTFVSLQWRHNERDIVSNHQPHNCLLNRLFRRRSKKTSKLCVTGLCAGNSPMTGEFPAQRASNAENVSIWWRHHVTSLLSLCIKLSTQHDVNVVTLWYRNFKRTKRVTYQLLLLCGPILLSTAYITCNVRHKLVCVCLACCIRVLYTMRHVGMASII